MSNIEVRKVTLNDIDSLQKFGKHTFAETFSEDNSEEDMQDYLVKGFSTEKLKAELTNQHSEFYFALLDIRIIGYLKVNFEPSQAQIKNESALEIERIYVLKEFHGKQVGQVLYDKAMGISNQKKVDYVWLGVWEENPRAIRFYQKNGFVEFDKRIFKLGSDEQTDILMKLRLS